MARQKREKSSTGTYHIMIRGIDKRNIFTDDRDKERFLYYLIKAKEKSNYTIYGYCLMDNHVHILIKEGNEEIGQSMKRITVGYVGWYNFKYSRTGHLLQNRYKSEVVETDEYFITLLRYIHQNPIKAKLVKNIREYKWSSYNQYIDKTKEVLVDTKFGMNYFTNNKDSFIRYMNKKNNDECLDYINKVKKTDEEIRKEIQEKYEISSIKNMLKPERDKTIKEIKENSNTSNRQLSRALEIGRGIIEKIN